MAASLIIIICLIFVEFTGWIQMLWLVLGVACIASLFTPKLRFLGIISGIAALSSTSWVARDWINFSASIVFLGLFRCFHNSLSFQRKHFTLPIFWIIGGAMALAWQLPFVAIICLVGLVASIPVPFIETPSWTNKYTYVVACVSLLWCMPYHLVWQKDGKVAYLEHGKWANADETWDIEHLNMRSAYSYSELLKLLNAERLDVSALNSEFDEAWMVTPTSPLTKDELSILQGWVKNGGSLILITDHTDVFGHGRVANQILQPLGLQTDYTAFFPTNQDDAAQDGWGGEYKMRTSATFGGYGVFPLITARWFNEAVDYSTKNFFGRLRATGEDEHSRRVVMGIRTLGRGRLILMADSTMFSNFGTYAPDSVRIASYLKSSFYLIAVYTLFPVILAAALFCRDLSKTYVISMLSLCIAMLMIGTLEKNGNLTWGEESEFLWWSGDSDLVQGERPPKDSLSTAYISSSLSTRKPRWTHSIEGIASGIWVSSQPPPTKGWRWLSPAKSDYGFESDDLLFEPLYNALDVRPLREWPVGHGPDPLLSGGIWTNDVLGDEWFDRGLSPARLERFKAFLSWVAEDSIPKRSASIVKGDLSSWTLKLPTRDTLVLKLPLPPGENGKIVYLGRGISGQWVEIANRLCLVGPKPYMESWTAPDMWILQPSEE